MSHMHLGAGAASEELDQLLFDGLAVTNPERYRHEALASLCDIFHRTMDALRAGEQEETPETIAVLRTTLKRISEITESIAEEPRREAPPMIRLLFEDDMRGLRPGSKLIFMGLDRMAHQVDRAEKAAQFESLGLRLGDSYEIAQLPDREIGKPLEIVAPGGRPLAICVSYFGRLL